MFFETALEKKDLLLVESLSYEERMVIWLFRLFKQDDMKKKSQKLRVLFGSDGLKLEKNLMVLEDAVLLPKSEGVVSLREEGLLSALAMVQHGLSLAFHNQVYRKALESIADILAAYGYWLQMPQNMSLFREEQPIRDQDSALELETDIYSLAAE